MKNNIIKLLSFLMICLAITGNSSQTYAKVRGSYDTITVNGIKITGWVNKGDGYATAYTKGNNCQVTAKVTANTDAGLQSAENSGRTSISATISGAYNVYGADGYHEATCGNSTGSFSTWVH